MIVALALGLRVLRHLVGIPFMLFGLAVARWPRQVAAFYAAAFGWIGLRYYQRRYESPSAALWIRGVGVLFAAISPYWIIVGTG